MTAAALASYSVSCTSSAADQSEAGRASLHEMRGDWSACVQVFVFGRSLGGAVAFWVAAANSGRINSLIIENTFWSIEAVTGKVDCCPVLLDLH